MGLISELPDILKTSYAHADELRRGSAGIRGWREQITADDDIDNNTVVMCDNSELLTLPLLSEKLDMIYCDPPFFTQTGFKTKIPVKSEIHPDIKELTVTAYEDKWKNKSDYLTTLAVRLILMKDTLKPTGSIFIHLDQRAAHPVKLLMDEIFGEKNYINEIIWSYKSGGATKRRLSRKHDTIFFYSKTEAYKFNEIKEKSYNRDMKPYHFKGVEEFKDDNGWYTLVNARDVWQISMVGRTSPERVNYVSQKPEKLVSKLIEMTTDPGDICADFFCGSGTLAICAEKLGRRFICCDESILAVQNTVTRLNAAEADFRAYYADTGSAACKIAVDKKHEALFELLKKDDPEALIPWSIPVSYAEFEMK